VLVGECQHRDQPSFDTTITSDPNAVTIEAGINQAISSFEQSLETPITVNIDFKEMSSGLGPSTPNLSEIPYSQYRTDLVNNATSANDATALASLSNTPINPVNSNADVLLTWANLRAVGETVLGNNHGGFDGTIGLNTSIMNLSRPAQNPSDYDLQTVASHEIDEALGIGGPGSYIGANFGTESPLNYPTGPVGSMDLFRYSGNGMRTYTTDPTATAYFSINSGATNLTDFNQSGGGSDFGDWKSGPTPQVQDAFGTPGAIINLGPNELTALDVIGYNLAVVPEPGSAILLLGGLIATGILRRRKGSEDVENREQEDPNDVDEVPVQTSALQKSVAIRRDISSERPK
jgi:hypothetical protein